jgi:hypothetical protein
MKGYIINEKAIQIDERQRYCEYTTKGLDIIDFPRLLEALENGSISIDKPAKFEDFLKPLTRWINEAPRKRFFRKMMNEYNGMIIMGSENFFTDDPDGDKIIDDLEATGKLAVYLRKELFGIDDVIQVEEYAQSWYEKGVYHEKGKSGGPK